MSRPTSNTPNPVEVPLVQVLDWYRGKLAEATERIAILEVVNENLRKERSGENAP